MNAYEELQAAARAAVTAILTLGPTDPPGSLEAASDALLDVILKVVGGVGHHAVLLTGETIHMEAYEMRHSLGLEK